MDYKRKQLYINIEFQNEIVIYLQIDILKSITILDGNL